MKWYKPIIIIIIINIVVSCTKYEEGPLLSLRSKKSRLEGEWQYDMYIENNIDKSIEIIDNKIIFEKKGDVYSYEYNRSTGVTNLYTGKWNFDNKRENLTIIISALVSDIYTTQIMVTKTYDCKIIMLKNNAIKLSGSIIKSNQYKISIYNIIIKLKK